MLVPKLRFKEFNDEWQQKELKDISNILSGKRIPKGLYAVNYNTGIPYITVSSMGDFFINEKEVQYITKDVEKYILKYKVNTNDIILSVAGTLGKLNVVQKNLSGANLTENCNKITNIDNNSYYLYVYYYLKFCIDKYILLLSTKSSQPKIALDRIRNMTINLPSLEEQTKIANFLSLIDRKIELQEKLVENLKLYKKGLLKKVFSNNLGWKTAKLNDISSILSGKRIPKGMDTVSYNTGIPYITVSNMGDFFVNENNIKYITNDVEKQILKYKVKTNDIIISVAGTLGKINIIQKNLCNANLTENCDKITNISKNINYLYLYYYLVVFINEYINSISTKSSQPKLALDKIRTFEIKYPSIEEQNRIANLFTSLDKKIGLETKKLQDLKTYKKGLLQKMFI